MRLYTIILALAVVLVGCGGGNNSVQPAASAQVKELSPAEKAKAIDDAHEHGVKAFPAKTEGKGNQPLTPEMDGDTKVFKLSVSKIKWEVEPGRKVDGYAFNNQIPGPMIRLTEGDKFRVIVRNDMQDESTSVHWHGLLVQNKVDGVPFITMNPIKPGESFTYEVIAKNAGSHMYHSHHNAVAQVTGGLLGALIVDPKDPATRTVYGETQDQVIIVNDGMLGYTINGKGFPATEPIVAKQGEKIRIRFMNEGQIIHPMHVHGLVMQVVEKDGFPLPQPFKADTVNVAPGERYDVVIDADSVGTWAFHCHILSHAESEHGMHGMVTAIIVQ